MELSPDRRSVALIELTTPLPFPARPLTSGTASRKRRLGMVELDTGELVHPVGAGDVMSHLLVWSPNGSDVLVISRPEDEAPADPRFLRVSAAGRVETLDGDGLRPWSVAARSGAEVFRAGWLGDDPVVLAARADEKPRWWHIGRADPESVSAALDAPGRWLAQTDHASAFEADGRVWRVDVSGRSAPLGDIGRRPLTLNSDAFGARLANDPMGAIEVLTRDEVGRVCRFALRHEGEPLCSASDPNDTVVAADPASGRIVTRRSDARGTTTLTLQDPGGDRRGLLTLNAGLATIDHAPPIALGPDAESGWLYLPSRPPGSPDRVPVVVVPYPGTRYGSPPRAMAPGGGNVHFNPQLLVAEGYAVLYPNLPRSPDAEPSAGIADAILAAVDLAARLHPIDSDRIGVWGWSFGGYGAVVAAAQSPRFKAIASMNGIMNLISVPGAIDPSVRLEADAGAYVVSGAGWLEGGQAGLQASLWQDPELYARNSPVLSADRISAPVLLITSDQDAGLAQNEEMFAALNRLNKPARLITYFGEGHALLSPANLREMYAAVIDWFDRFLRRGETPGSPSSAEASLP